LKDDFEVELQWAIIVVIPSPVVTGSFGGSRPPNKAPSHLDWNRERYKSVEFLSNFRMSSSPEQT